MKKFLKFILWSLPVLLLLIIGAIFVFIKTFDLDKYKTQISDIVYEKTGRKLTLNGHASLKISLIPNKFGMFGVNFPSSVPFQI